MRMTGPSPARSASTARCRDNVVFPAPPFCEARTITCIVPSATPWARTAAAEAPRTDGPTANRATGRQSIRSCGYPCAWGYGAQYGLLCAYAALRNCGSPQVPTCGVPHVRNHALPILRNTVLAELRKFARPHFSKSPAHRPQTLGPSRSQAGDAAPTTARHSEFQILAEHIERLVPSEAVELGGVGAPGHAGLSAPRCRLWPPNSSPPEADGRRACQHDAGDRAWSGRRGAAPGQRGAARAGASKSGGTARLERYRRRRARRSARAPDRIRCGRSRRGQGGSDRRCLRAF
jgi:hypothetical protein